MGAEVISMGALDMQVCVPADSTDAEVIAFAEQENPCGTEYSWAIRRQGDVLLKGDAERVPCRDRAGHVHIMLDA